MNKQDKPVYETPKVMRLDDSTQAIGGETDNACSPTGSSATDDCRNGGSPGQWCLDGSTFSPP